MTDDELKELIEVSKKATPRPWYHAWDWSRPMTSFPSYAAWAEGPMTKGDSLSEVESQANLDAKFIVSSCNNASEMAAEILRLRDALRKYAAHDNWDRLATYCNYLEFDAPGDFENGWELAEEALKEGE